jgi:hypothetical protein
VVVERLTSLPSSLHHVDAARQEYERQHHDGGLGLPNRWNTSRRIVIVVRAEGRDGSGGGGLTHESGYQWRRVFVKCSRLASTVQHRRDRCEGAIFVLDDGVNLTPQGRYHHDSRAGK